MLANLSILDEAVSYFCQKTTSLMFNWVLNTSVTVVIMYRSVYSRWMSKKWQIFLEVPQTFPTKFLFTVFCSSPHSNLNFSENS